MKKWNINEVSDLSGKNIVITGANTGLGYETSLAIASKNGHVIMACRSLERATKAKESIIQKYPNASIDIILVDLGDISSISTFAEAYKKKYKKLDILINNAGVMTTPYMKTKDGFEFQNGINHLGHFVLTSKLFDVIKSTENSRIVVVSSIAHRGATIQFEDYMFEDSSLYTPMKSYKQSKLSNLLFMNELNRRIKEKDYRVTVVAAHPGVSRTELTRYVLKGVVAFLALPLMLIFTQSAKKGALPQLRAALDKDVQSGEYYGPNGFKEMKGHPIKVDSEDNAKSIEDAKRLWELSEKLTDSKFTV